MAAPGAWDYTSPKSGARGVQLTPTVAWSAASGATGYTMLLREESSKGSGSFLTGNMAVYASITGTSFAFPGSPGVNTIGAKLKRGWRYQLSGEAESGQDTTANTQGAFEFVVAGGRGRGRSRSR